MPPSLRRLFAVIPAAGRSRRMGQPKLMLPFGETTVIGRLLQTLAAAQVESFVLIRSDDDALRAEVARAKATIIQPDAAPPEMRVSVEHLLQSIEETRHPGPDDGWLLIPADHPLLSVETLRRLIETWQRSPQSIVLPCHNGRHGHPTIFPWSLAAEVAALPADVGVNQLLRNHPGDVVEADVNDPNVTLDLDTPADYERALRHLS